MDQVVATDSGFIAIGEAEYDFHAGFGAGTAIWTSSDGRTWTRLADKAAPPRGTRLQSVVAGIAQFLAMAALLIVGGVIAACAIVFVRLPLNVRRYRLAASSDVGLANA